MQQRPAPQTRGIPACRFATGIGAHQLESRWPDHDEAASRRRDVLTPPGLSDVRTFEGGRTAPAILIWARLLVASVSACDGKGSA